MAKPTYFVVYEDDEGRIEVIGHNTEDSMIKSIALRYQQRRDIPEYMIRGERRPVSIETIVRLEEPK